MERIHMTRPTTICHEYMAGAPRDDWSKAGLQLIFMTAISSMDAYTPHLYMH
jgi:hypothetical protein